MILNTIVAESVDFIADELEKRRTEEFNTALQNILQEIIRKHKRIIFNGDNYSDGWVQEAARRGLPNLRTTVEAIEPLRDPANHALFERYGVLSATEMMSRYEISLSEYNRKLRIEAGVALEMARNMIFCAASDEFGKLSAALSAAGSAGISAGRKALYGKTELLGGLLDDLSAAADQLEAVINSDYRELLSALERLRQAGDKLEQLVDDRCWPFPKYREMLFIY